MPVDLNQASERYQGQTIVSSISFQHSESSQSQRLAFHFGVTRVEEGKRGALWSNALDSYFEKKCLVKY
jgi:hypothetical protein